MKTPNTWCAVVLWVLLSAPGEASAADARQDRESSTVLVPAEGIAVQAEAPAVASLPRDIAPTPVGSSSGEAAAGAGERARSTVLKRAVALGRGIGAEVGPLVAHLASWGVPPAALLGVAGLPLILLASRMFRKLGAGRGRVGRAQSRTSRLRPPHRPACRDARQLEAALRARKAA